MTSKREIRFVCGRRGHKRWLVSVERDGVWYHGEADTFDEALKLAKAARKAAK